MDAISATEEKGTPRLYTSATIHTTMGDIHVELYPKVARNSFGLLPQVYFDRKTPKS